MKNYDVIVIGAGNGGLASAATLAEKRKSVIVFEKHNIPGGCGRQPSVRACPSASLPAA